MQDRLGDLRQVASQVNPHVAEKMRTGPSAVFNRDYLDIEAQMGFSHNKNSFMGEYFAHTEAIKSSLMNVSETITSIRELKNRATVATTPEAEKEASISIQKALDTANREVLRTKKILEDLKRENVEFSKENANSTEAKIRDNVHQALSRKFREVLLEYQTVQTEYKKEVKGKVERQVKIVCPEASDQEVREMVDEGQVSEIIQARIQGVIAHTSLRNALSDLQDKYRDIRRLEQNVSEIHQLFVDLATLVDAQGELLDQIEFSVTSAKDYTEKADKELVSARKNQKKAQRRMCWLSCCFITLAVIVLIVVLVFVLK